MPLILKKKFGQRLIYWSLPNGVTLTVALNELPDLAENPRDRQYLTSDLNQVCIFLEVTDDTVTVTSSAGQVGSIAVTYVGTDMDTVMSEYQDLRVKKYTFRLQEIYEQEHTTATAAFSMPS